MRIHQRPFKNYNHNYDNETKYTDSNEGKDLKKYKFTAYCTSYMCTGNVSYDTKIKPNANKHDDFCRDCGSALFWEKKEI